jgi:hypothetical protein
MVLLLKQDSHWKSANMKTYVYLFINNEPAATVIGPMMDTRLLRVKDHAQAVTVGDEETTAGSLVTTVVVAAEGAEVDSDEETAGSLVTVIVVAAEGAEVGDEETVGSLVGTGPQQYGAYAAAYLAQKASLKRL